MTLQDAFAFDFSKGVDDSGTFLGTVKATGLRPRFAERFEELGIAIDQRVFTTRRGGLRCRPCSSSGIVAVFAALAIGAAVILLPRRASGKAGAALADRLLGDGVRRAGLEDRLELAGITTPASDASCCAW